MKVIEKSEFKGFVEIAIYISQGMGEGWVGDLDLGPISAAS